MYFKKIQLKVHVGHEVFNLLFILKFSVCTCTTRKNINRKGRFK